MLTVWTLSLVLSPAIQLYTPALQHGRPHIGRTALMFPICWQGRRQTIEPYATRSGYEPGAKD